MLDDEENEVTERSGGARNPKVERVQVRLAGDIDGRLNRVSDRLGLNKGTAASMLVALGLGVIEQVLFANETSGAAMAGHMSNQFDNTMTRDLDSLGIPHK